MEEKGLGSPFDYAQDDKVLLIFKVGSFIIRLFFLFSSNCHTNFKIHKVIAGTA